MATTKKTTTTTRSTPRTPARRKAEPSFVASTERTIKKNPYASAAVATGVNVGASTGQRFGYTLLLDLTTGKVVWANFMASETGDLRNAEDAKKVVQSMLAGLPL